MQQHKRNRHSGSHANVAVNRAHKRAAIYMGPNRAARRLDGRVGREVQAAIDVQAALLVQPS